MEQMPHHREGIQNNLDKAHDEGHRDNKTIDDDEEVWEIVDKESSIKETIALLKLAGYLDTSFEGKEVHPLAVRALSKEEVLAEYKTRGGKTWGWEELEKNMPYVTPKVENLDVIIINFNKEVTPDEAVAEMDKLGVRPLTYEELSQYGLAHPSHQDHKILVALGSKLVVNGSPKAPIIGVFGGGVYNLNENRRASEWVTEYRFPVVRK